MVSDNTAALTAALIPNMGFLMAEWIGHKFSRDMWIQDLSHPPWVTESVRSVLTTAWATANFMLGYASFVVWDAAGRWEGNRLPLASYLVLLVLFWAHFPIYMASHSLTCGFVDIVLATVASIVTLVLFGQVSTPAALFMSLFLVLLANECYYSFWILKHNQRINEPKTESMNHTGDGESSTEPTETIPKENY